MKRKSHRYPTELQAAEAMAIAQRRSIVEAHGASAPMEMSVNTSGQQPPPSEPAPGGGVVTAPGGAHAMLPRDTVGLALSGGGIRSATFCLGFLQALARERLLRRIDILSSVSGGGYIAGFLGRFYDRLRITPKLAPDIVETAVANSNSPQIHNLRTHAQYIAPSGKADLQEGFGIFLRNFLTLHFVIGTLIFGLYGLANALRYGVLNRINVVLPFFGVYRWNDMPIGRIVVAANLHVFWSPWFMLVELMLLLFALPRAISYWLCSQDETEAYSRPALLTMFVLLLSLLWLTVRDGLNLQAFSGAVAILISFPLVEYTWKQVREKNQALGTGGESIQRLRARTYLSRELGLWLALTGIFLYLALIDTAGHAIYEAYYAHNVGYVEAMGQLGAGLVALLPILRGAADLMANFQSKKPNPSFWTRMLGRPSVSAIMAVLLLAPPLVFVSYVSHASFRGGQSGGLRVGLGLALFTLGLSAIVACRKALPLINRTSLQATYAARLARTFLGASNPFREDSSFDDVVPNDDVDSLRDYRPYEAGGPLHLINACINQTVDLSSLQNIGHRLGASFACSPLGLSIGPRWHALWDGKSTIKAIDHMPGTDHPLLGVDGSPPESVKILPLRDWLSISGAACGPGMGNRTNAALSVLFTLANLRTGYWWDSGLSAGDRGTRPDVSFTRRLIWLLANMFQTQSRLLSEALARFVGPWDRLWYLSDGGHFENLGGYELIRRQVPYILMADSSADSDYDYDDFANFQQKIRIDFQADLEPLGQSRWNAAVAADLARMTQKGAGATTLAAARAEWDRIREQVSLDAGDGGPLEQLICRPPEEGMPVVKKHAALLRVNYADGSHSLLLYVKSSMSGDESPDICHYFAENPDFPHQSTAQQFFNEEQWESYRQLGEHIGGRLFGATPEMPGALPVLWLTRLDNALHP